MHAGGAGADAGRGDLPAHRNPVQPFNTLYQLAATKAREPDWLERARSFLMLPDYFHYRLCGVVANEYTNATTTQLFGMPH